MTETSFSQANPAFSGDRGRRSQTPLDPEVEEVTPEPEPEPEGVVFEDATVVVFEDEAEEEDAPTEEPVELDVEPDAPTDEEPVEE